MEEIKVSEMLQADSIEKDNAVMIIQEGVNKKASGSIQTATGTSLSLTSVADTCKVTSNSKNLFDEKIEQGGFNGGTPEDNTTRLRSSNFTKVNANTTYTVSVPSNMKVIVVFYNASMSFISSTDGWVNITRTFTTPANTNYLKLLIGKQGDGNVTPSEVSNVQLEEGSTATSYNPYNTEVEICGKNLFDESIINNLWTFADGTISAWTGTCIQKYKCSEGDTFTLKATYSTTDTQNNIIAIAFFDSSNTLIGRTANNTTLEITSTAPANTAYMYAGHYVGKPTTIQLEKGSTATTYEPYKADTLILTPDETKSAFTYDSLTNVISNGNITIEYNIQSRLLNNEDVLDIVEPVKEYVDETKEELLENDYDVYSTDEKRIGTWKDGRPLYRKVIDYTIPSGTTSIGISLGVANMRLVQRAEVRFNAVGSGDYVFNSYYSSASDYMRFFMRSNELQIRLGSNTSGFNIVAIVEYTKSTD